MFSLQTLRIFASWEDKMTHKSPEFFKTMFSFYVTFDLMTFSGNTEMEHSAKMGLAI